MTERELSIVRPVVAGGCACACGAWSCRGGTRRTGTRGSGRASRPCACAGAWPGGRSARTPGRTTRTSTASRRYAGARAASACRSARTCGSRRRTSTRALPPACCGAATRCASPAGRTSRTLARKRYSCTVLSSREVTSHLGPGEPRRLLAVLGPARTVWGSCCYCWAGLPAYRGGATGGASCAHRWGCAPAAAAPCYLPGAPACWAPRPTPRLGPVANLPTSNKPN